VYEVIAKVKQLRIPTWFMTLSCAHLRWPKLFQILTRIQGNDLTDKQVNALSYIEVSDDQSYSVVAAKLFQFRVETFFTKVLRTDVKPTGKIVYYALSAKL